MVYEVIEKNSRVKLICYVLEPSGGTARTKVRPGVIICPGGAYRHLSARESEPIASGLMAAGFHAFVLEYSVAESTPVPLGGEPLDDLEWAFGQIRARSDKWMTGELALMGSSAGGHLAASYCTCAKAKNLPDAMILSYPVITSGEAFRHQESFENLLGKGFSREEADKLSPERHVSKYTPPAFIWHTFEDKTVPVENSLLFASALREAGVAFELHIFPNGSHGLSLATPETETSVRAADTHVAHWFPLCLEWLSGIFDWKV